MESPEGARDCRCEKSAVETAISTGQSFQPSGDSNNKPYLGNDGNSDEERKRSLPFCRIIGNRCCRRTFIIFRFFLFLFFLFAFFPFLCQAYYRRSVFMEGFPVFF